MEDVGGDVDQRAEDVVEIQRAVELLVGAVQRLQPAQALLGLGPQAGVLDGDGRLVGDGRQEGHLVPAGLHVGQVVPVITPRPRPW